MLTQQKRFWKGRKPQVVSSFIFKDKFFLKIKILICKWLFKTWSIVLMHKKTFSSVLNVEQNNTSLMKIYLVVWRKKYFLFVLFTGSSSVYLWLKRSIWSSKHLITDQTHRLREKREKKEKKRKEFLFSRFFKRKPRTDQRESKEWKGDNLCNDRWTISSLSFSLLLFLLSFSHSFFFSFSLSLFRLSFTLSFFSISLFLSLFLSFSLPLSFFSLLFVRSPFFSLFSLSFSVFLSLPYSYKDTETCILFLSFFLFVLLLLSPFVFFAGLF